MRSATKKIKISTTLKNIAGLFVLLLFLAAATSGVYATGGPIFASVSSSEGNDFVINVKDSIMSITHSKLPISASVSSTTLDQSSLELLRSYYNSPSASDREMFNKFVQLKKSYINSSEELYRMSFLYGDKNPSAFETKTLSESNMKLFYQSEASLYGETASIFIYNTSRHSTSAASEQTHIDLIIPVPSDYSIISIYISLPAGSLTTAAADAINNIITSLSFEGLPLQSELLSLLQDTRLTAQINAGIYPDPGTAADAVATDLSALNNSQAGFSLKYPSTWQEYMPNNIGGQLFYASFKPSPGVLVSVSSKPSLSSFSSVSSVSSVETEAEADIAFIKFSSFYPLKISAQSKVTISGKDFQLLEYSKESPSGIEYFHTLYALNNGKLYTLELRTASSAPTEGLLAQFKAMAQSISFTSPVSAASPVSTIKPDTASQPRVVTFLNAEEGYTFGYPENWQLRDVSSEITHEQYELVLPSYSAAIKVLISEGTIAPIKDTDLAVMAVTGVGAPNYSSLLRRYNAPYLNAPNKLLSVSASEQDGTIVISRLLDYLDENSRNRLCFVKDIIRGERIYSLFISVSEYMAPGGTVEDLALRQAVDTIASSFKTSETDILQARISSGETRARQVVQLENLLKDQLGQSARISSVSANLPDKSIYAVIEGIEESGYYKVLPDFDSGYVTIISRVLKTDILLKELQQVFMKTDTMNVTRVYLDQEGMRFNVANGSTTSDSRVYKVNVEMSPKGLTWETEIDDHAQSLRIKSRSYIRNLLGSTADVRLQSDEEFSSIEAYRKINRNYYTSVFVQYQYLEGFFTLSTNPWNDEMKLVTFKTLGAAANEILQKVHSGNSRYQVSDFSFNRDTFVMSVTISNYANSAVEDAIVKYKVILNPETLELDYQQQ